ncbi:MAG: SU10 major capsid protein, partial [Bradyrhizobium sp.]
AKATGNDTTARKTASVTSWIKSNTSKGTAGGAADPSTADGAGTRTDGTQRAFTEANLKTVLQSIWTNGGKPDVIFTGAFNKQVFSTFTGRATAIEEAKSKKIVASVDAYESDFGKLKVVANRFQRPRDVLVLEMDKWAVAYLNGRNMISLPLAKTGDSERRQILAEYALVARNEKASGGVFDNTAA